MLNLYRLNQEVIKDENLYYLSYEEIKKELLEVEKQMKLYYLDGKDITRQLRYRNKLEKILSSCEPYDVEHQDFYEKYKWELN